MIGQVVCDNDGFPLGQNGSQLSESAYQPNDEVKGLFARVMADYQIAWKLQHRPFREFDGYSLLQRARLDQETFGVYVGVEDVPQHKKWRWKGRKNTARNKLIGILAHMIAGMLYPAVFAHNEQNEEDKMTAKAMAILVEDELKKAKYETQFLFMVLSALVNPAVHVYVEYIEALQTIKQKLKDGKIKIVEAVDEMMSGTFLNVVPIDEILISDFYTSDIQQQPFVIRVRRISYDTAKSIYGKHPNFQYVQAGQTRIVQASREKQVLYDIDWTEADSDFVQEITAYYRSEDVEVVFVGGVFIGSEEDVYNTNQFTHRRFSLINDEWMSVPVLPYCKSYFEPIDPSGRFYFGKSGAFKEYWDALSQDKMYQLAHDGTYLDVIKPIFISGIAKGDGIVLAPGAVTAMPAGSNMTPYQLSPNIASAMQIMGINKDDMAESTQDKIMSGIVEKGVTAYATSKAEQNARIFLGVFGVFMSQLIRDVGALIIDCIIMNKTIGELDASIPENLMMKYKPMLIKGKERGSNVTHKMIFTDRQFGKVFKTQEEKDKWIEEKEWHLYNEAGGDEQRVWEINPYKFARTKYYVEVDADQMTMKSAGADIQRKQLAKEALLDPRIAQFVDLEAVAEDYVFEEYSEGDPDRYKAKGNPGGMMQGMGMMQKPPQPNQLPNVPQATGQVNNQIQV